MAGTQGPWVLLWPKPTLLCALGQSVALSELSFHQSTQTGERIRSPGRVWIQKRCLEQHSIPVHVRYVYTLCPPWKF